MVWKGQKKLGLVEGNIRRKCLCLHFHPDFLLSTALLLSLFPCNHRPKAQPIRLSSPISTTLLLSIIFLTTQTSTTILPFTILPTFATF